MRLFHGSQAVPGDPQISDRSHWSRNMSSVKSISGKVTDATAARTMAFNNKELMVFCDKKGLDIRAVRERISRLRLRDCEAGIQGSRCDTKYEHCNRMTLPDIRGHAGPPLRRMYLSQKTASLRGQLPSTRPMHLASTNWHLPVVSRHGEHVNASRAVYCDR